MENVALLLTALSSVVLAYLTYVLASETEKMRIENQSAQIIASIEGNIWSFRHFDLVIMNCGKATAFDIEINLKPDHVKSEVRSDGKVPFKHLSLLKPNEKVSSSFSDWENIRDTVFEFDISWATRPKSSFRSKISYELDMNHLAHLSQLGKNNPLVDIAENLKKIREKMK